MQTCPAPAPIAERAGPYLRHHPQAQNAPFDVALSGDCGGRFAVHIGGSRATGATSDCHDASPLVQHVSDLIAESAFWLAAAIAVVIEHRTSSSGRKRR